MKNVVKVDEICEKLSTSHSLTYHQNWNLFFGNFLLKYEPCIKDKKLHDEEEKIYSNFFYFYILKELSPKNFHKFGTKGDS